MSEELRGHDGRQAQDDSRVRRQAVRIVLVDQRQTILLLSTRDASNPTFGESWELPGGGLRQGEDWRDAAVREILEETGLMVEPGNVGEPLWHREVLYTYRGERRLQQEAICVANISETAPNISTAQREPFEIEDHQLHRWWTIEEMRSSEAQFYPRNLPVHAAVLLAGNHVDEPTERWDYSTSGPPTSGES